MREYHTGDVGATYHLRKSRSRACMRTFVPQRLGRTKWRRQKSHRQVQKHGHPVLRSLYKRSKARTFTAMPSRSSDSRCLVAARPCATGTGKSSRPRHFRREKMRRRLGEYNQIGGGLVRRLCVCVWRTWLMIYTATFFFLAGNTRVISQTALDHFRTSLQTKKHDPYSVLLRRNKLPMQLLDDAANPNLRKVR